MWDGFKHASIAAVFILLIFGFAAAVVVFVNTKQCNEYAQIKGATSNYSWLVCYITKDGKTLTLDEYMISEAGNIER